MFCHSGMILSVRFGTCFNCLRAKLFQMEQKHVFTFYVIILHLDAKGSLNPSWSKTTS